MYCIKNTLFQYWKYERLLLLRSYCKDLFPVKDNVNCHIVSAEVLICKNTFLFLKHHFSENFATVWSTLCPEFCTRLILCGTVTVCVKSTILILTFCMNITICSRNMDIWTFKSNAIVDFYISIKLSWHYINFVLFKLCLIWWE